MLLRTVALLLLCASLGTCATLGHYQAQAEEGEEEREAPAVSPSADAADLPAVEEPAAGDPAADKPEADALGADGATAEVRGMEGDGQDGDIPATTDPAEEAVAKEQPSSPEQKQEKEEEEEEEEEENEIIPVKTNQSLDSPVANEENNSWSLNSIRNSFQTVHGYFDSLVELVGGHNGVCQYRCRYGDAPLPRQGYQLPEPNGCSSSLVGLQLDLGIPAMTKCCDGLDACYDTCGASKYDCDGKFRACLLDICSDLKRSLGFVSKVQACESMADGLYNAVWTLGCRPYMNSQRAACVCQGEERDEL